MKWTNTFSKLKLIWNHYFPSLSDVQVITLCLGLTLNPWRVNTFLSCSLRECLLNSLRHYPLHRSAFRTLHLHVNVTPLICRLLFFPFLKLLLTQKMHNAQNIWYGKLGIVLWTKTNYKNKILYNTGDKNNKNWKYYVLSTVWKIIQMNNCNANKFSQEVHCKEEITYALT